MKHINHWIQRYLMLVWPVVLVTMIWGSIQSDSEIRSTSPFVIKMLWEVMSWSLILWFVCLILFMIFLVFRKETQESTIKLIAGIKERDEREQVIMGMAARRSFVATTALIIVLLFVSCFTLNVAKLSNQTMDGKKSSLTIGFHFTATEKKPTLSSDGHVVFEHHDLPLSKSAILLLVLIWQMAAFRINAKKALAET